MYAAGFDGGSTLAFLMRYIIVRVICGHVFKKRVTATDWGSVNVRSRRRD